jgi:cytoskeletal protein RodZ
MFKRVIKIILIMLAIFLLILGIMWLIGRHTAQKNGNTPLSFKQFIGLSDKTSSNGTNGTGGGTLSSNFGNNGSNNGSGNGNGSGQGTGGINGSNTGIGNNNGDSNLGGVNGIGSNGIGNGINMVSAPTISQFTSGGITATNGYGGGAAGNPTTNTTNTGAGTQNNSPTTTGTTVNTAPICGTADTTITFTPEELDKLNTLQNRFYTIAQTLHTDADAQAELTNHDAFEIKSQQATELYNQCEALLPALPEPMLQEHIATPFWEAWSTTDPTNPNLWQPIGPEQQDTLLYASNYNNTNLGTPHLADIHDNGNGGNNPDTSGIKGPYGLLSFSDPAIVPITGSVVKNNSTTTNTFFGISMPNPFNLPTPAIPSLIKYVPLPGLAGVGTKTVTSNADWQLLVPVVENILRINLW